MKEDKKKALLIRLSSLGDVVFNIPLANALKDEGYEVTWLVSEKGLQVVENNPCVDETVFVPLYKWRKRGFSLENFKEYLSILKQLRAKKFDVAIDCQMMFKSLYWMLFCGAKRKLVSRQGRELSFLGGNEWVKSVSYIPETSVVLNYLQYAKHLGINPDKLKLSLPAHSKEQIEKVNNLLSGLDKTKPLVVIAPATTWGTKHWKKENWKIVVDNLCDICNIVFTGGPDNIELIEFINCGRFLNLAGKTDILELAEVFSRANVVVTPDSGSAHLAWATGKPAVVTIFTCTPKTLFAPIGDSKKYIALGGEGLPCQPCFKKQCKLRKNPDACTCFPNPRDVMDVVKSLIF